MSTTNIYEIAFAVIGSIGGAGVIIFGLSSFLGKVWAQRLMQMEIAKHAEQLEELKSKFKKNETEHLVRFTGLHEKQADIIAKLYYKLYEVNLCRDTLTLQLQCREIKESYEREYKTYEPWEYIYGVHTLTDEEREMVDALKVAVNDMNSFYGRHKLYLSSECCELMNRVTQLSFFISSNYSNVALKDEKGEYRVNPKVPETWNASIEAIHTMLPLLDSEFKNIIGVDKVT
ncbi:hypothetical protein A6E05_19070 [Aliivibrio sp. 1S165]|uniref:hypothetical protein n=1 Tax=unclassified Aliivibrio TaxID=2645654 RepID=UPI00080E6B92|nr:MULTISPECIES: hypothetical protein [unclassified Aliivibrio]OCH14601.1 hypothetical protein A6E05_19070 [Aliivibrio sp. 1S165]OCH27216.1 hypothetical protein A6E06_19430 [Aliivibrio sp. 1S175]